MRKTGGKRAFIGGFDHAWEGISRAVRTQRNMRFHALAAVAVVIASLVFGVSLTKFAILLFAMTLVLALEMVNTAVEAVVDLATDEYHSLAKIAKDAAAGAVLISAVGAALVGAVVFVPEIYGLVANVFRSP